LNLFDWDVVNRWGKQRFVLWIHRCRKLWSHEFVLLRSVLKCIGQNCVVIYLSKIGNVLF